MLLSNDKLGNLAKTQLLNHIGFDSRNTDSY